MLRILLLFILILTSTTAVAQSGLQWEIDTLTVSQSGCASAADTFIVNFTNTSPQPVTLTGLTGVGGRWVVENAEAYQGMVVAPGGSHAVSLRFTAKGTKFDNEALFLRSQDGTNHDTLPLREDITTYSLLAYHGTSQFLDLRRPLGDTLTAWEIWYAATGSAPVIVEDFWFEGDSSLWAVRRGPDTIPNGTLGTQPVSKISFYYAPNEEGSDTITTFLKGYGCDSVHSFRLVVTAAIPAPPGLYWTRDQTNLSSKCGGVATATVSLRNSLDVEAFVDSIRVINDPIGHFAFAGPGTNAFVLPPSTVVDYTVMYTPPVDLNVLHDAVLVAYGANGQSDSIYLSGISSASGGRADDTLFDLGNAYVRANWDQYAKIYGNGSFVISEIRIEGPMTVTVSNIKPGDAVSQWGTRIYYTVTADTPGPQITTVTFLGAECDTPIVVRFKGDFQEWSSAADPNESVDNASWDGKYLSFPFATTAIEIYDILGRHIQTLARPETSVDLSHLVPGNYILHWEDSTGRRVMKIQR